MAYVRHSLICHFCGIVSVGFCRLDQAAEPGAEGREVERMICFRSREVVVLALMLLFVLNAPLCFGHPDILASVRDCGQNRLRDRGRGRYRLVLLTWNDDQSVFECHTFLSLGDADVGTPAYRDGRIAFTSNKSGKYDIYLLAAGESSPVNVTGEFSGNFSDPSFMDDGTLVCAGNIEGRNSVCLIDPRRGVLENLTGQFVNAGQPAVGVEKKRFVFTGIRDGTPVYNGNTDIYLYDAASSISRLTAMDSLVNENHPYLADDYVYYSAASGRYVNGSFVVERSNLFKYDLESGTVSAITSGAGIKSSPEVGGDLIYFLALESTGERNLYMVDGEREIRLTQGLFVMSFCCMGSD